MLTLAQAARRDALEIVSRDSLVRWRADIKAECLALIKARFEKSQYAQIDNIDMKWIDGPLDDGLCDATHHLIWEME